MTHAYFSHVMKKVQLDILNSIFGCFGVGGHGAFPPAESILSESHSPKVPKVLFKNSILP